MVITPDLRLYLNTWMSTIYCIYLVNCCNNMYYPSVKNWCNNYSAITTTCTAQRQHCSRLFILIKWGQVLLWLDQTTCGSLLKLKGSCALCSMVVTFKHRAIQSCWMMEYKGELVQEHEQEQRCLTVVPYLKVMLIPITSKSIMTLIKCDYYGM